MNAREIRESRRRARRRGGPPSMERRERPAPAPAPYCERYPEWDGEEAGWEGEEKSDEELRE